MSRAAIAVLSAILLLLGTPAARAEEKPLRIVLTSDLRKVFYYGRDIAADGPAGKFANAVGAQRDIDPDMFLIDAGYSLAPVALMETGYGYPSHTALTKLKADAIHLTAADTVFGASRSWGLSSVTDPDIAAKYVGRLGYKGLDNSNFTPRGAVEARHGSRGVRVVSLADPSRFGAWKGTKERFVFDENEALKSFRMTGDANTYTIALAEMDAAVLARVAAATERPDLIVDLSGKRDGAVRAGGTGAPIVTLPPLGSILVLEVKPDGTVTSTVTPFMDAKRMEAAWAPQIPQIGVGIGNAATSLPERLGAKKDNINTQVFDRTEDGDISSIKRIRCFLADINGKPSRVWRLINGMLFISPDGAEREAGGWARADMLLVFDTDHKLQRIVSRGPMTMMDYDIDLEPFYKSLYGKDPADWKVELSLYPGAEDMLAWLLSDFRKAAELDRRLYPSETKAADPAK